MVFEAKNIRAPSLWSQTAVEIAASKYFRMKGKSKKRETSVQEMVERVVKSLVSAGRKQKLFRTAAAARVFGQELKMILYSQRAFFNSPVWFNLGLFASYGVTSKSPCWVFDDKKKKAVLKQEALQNPQISACFIQSVEDSLESIFELAKVEARLFKFGSGSGTNFSNLRSRFENLESGGQSSGLISFLEVLDRGAGAIKSGGTTRRAAKMVILDIDHLEVEDFIRWKVREEEKAKALMAAGFGESFESEAYRTVSGQNANNAIRVPDAFFEALKKNQDWVLKSKTKSGPQKKVKAQKLFEQLAQAAWACADPGLQLGDTINDWHTCPKSGEIRGSNPCSEYLFLDDSACNLASLNLVRFMGADGQFDLAGFEHTAKVMFTAQELLVGLAGYPTQKIAENSARFRPLGLGIAGLGGF